MFLLVRVVIVILFFGSRAWFRVCQMKLWRAALIFFLDIFASAVISKQCNEGKQCIAHVANTTYINQNVHWNLYHIVFHELNYT
jgi:hypothetical protein